MRIELFSTGSDNFPWGLFVLWGIVWLGVLFRILSREDFDTPSKILWTMVVIFVPFFGVPLYWFVAPSPESPRRQRKTNETFGGDVAGTPWADNPGFTNDK